MKLLSAVLISLFVLLQYKLWFDRHGVPEVWQLQKHMKAQNKENDLLKQRNEALTAEVDDLKHGQAALEERARTDLGMVKKDETFYQVVD